MSGRTPSFIVVGLVIIMFLLGLFYMSCSSKNTELRLSLEQFEERFRSLTLKNSDSEKKYDNLNTRKRELEEEKATIQRQMEKKDSEVNDLNTKLNEKIAELKSLQSDKKVLDEQLKDYQSLSETIASKNSLIEKLQQQLNEQKNNNNDEFARLKRENEALKTNIEPKSTFIIPPQRFRPMETNNFTTKTLAALFQDPLNKLNNLTKEMKPQPVPVVFGTNEKLSDGNTNVSTTTIINQQPNVNNDKNQLEVGQNVPPPPLANNAQRQQQPDHVESAQAAPKPLENNQGAAAPVDNPQYQNKLQSSLNSSLSENHKANGNEHDDEADLNFDNEQGNENLPRRNNVEDNNNGLVDAPAVVKSKRKSYRSRDRQRIRQQQQQLDNGEEMDAYGGNREDRQVKKRSVL